MKQSEVSESLCRSYCIVGKQFDTAFITGVEKDRSSRFPRSLVDNVLHLEGLCHCEAKMVHLKMTVHALIIISLVYCIVIIIHAYF